MRINSQVQDALDKQKPVVALESTVISHGLPFPENIAIALEMEEQVHSTGALPATIAIVDGEIVVGLTHAEIEYIAEHGARKCSRREIPIVTAQGVNGATTVAATMVLAHMAGIKVFATGGIGGVHRGSAFDISADLTELERTPVCVVCSGAKSILDIPATLEVLETKSVPVIGFGVDYFPAFYSVSSGLPVSQRVDDPDQVAEILHHQHTLGYTSGILVAVPVPDEHALELAAMETLINSALRDAVKEGVSGSAVTPYMLAKLAEISKKETIAANRALLLNNCRVAAHIAHAVANQ
ncbi:MAG: pseudouridine-5'-phosphate glycosidase [Chloroflexota bacterium]